MQMPGRRYIKFRCERFCHIPDPHKQAATVASANQVLPAAGGASLRRLYHQDLPGSTAFAGAGCAGAISLACSGFETGTVLPATGVVAPAPPDRTCAALCGVTAAGVLVASVPGAGVCAGVAACCAKAAIGTTARLAARTLHIRLGMGVIVVILFRRAGFELLPA